MLYIAHPYCMLSLRHWRLSAIRAETAAMMADRYAHQNRKAS
jgi:hypothetical protein